MIKKIFLFLSLITPSKQLLCMEQHLDEVPPLNEQVLQPPLDELVVRHNEEQIKELWLACKEGNKEKATQFQIFAYMPIECRHADIERIILPHMSQETCIIRYLKETITQDDRAMLLQTLETPNHLNKKPLQLTTDPKVQKLLDPLTYYEGNQ